MRVMIELEHLKALVRTADRVADTYQKDGQEVPHELDAALFVADTVIAGAETPEG
ncbi:hypothetical protein [Bradyrhizobium phage BDU-MI-1]|nr:hypothetical protein [Bradyrhizobium phage BDU-MI-1]